MSCSATDSVEWRSVVVDMIPDAAAFAAARSSVASCVPCPATGAVVYPSPFSAAGLGSQAR